MTSWKFLFQNNKIQIGNSTLFHFFSEKSEIAIFDISLYLGKSEILKIETRHSYYYFKISRDFETEIPAANSKNRISLFLGKREIKHVIH